MRLFRRRLRINLALQGGGAHGAFTWGVLDRLLEDGRSRSAGSAPPAPAPSTRWPSRPALRRAAGGCACQAARGVGGRGQAPACPISCASTRCSPASAGRGVAQVATLFSPYEFNPLGFDPLRRLLEAHIDFARIRADAPRAADRRDRRSRPGGPACSAAPRSRSRRCWPPPACRPCTTPSRSTGSPTGTAASRPTPTSSRSRARARSATRVIVQIAPLATPGLPTGPREIAAHVNQLTFNAPMLRDVAVIEAVRQMSAGRFGVRAARCPTRRAPLPPDRCRPHDERAQPREQGEAGLEPAHLPARGGPHRDPEVARWQSRRHRPPRHRRPPRPLPSRRPPRMPYRLRRPTGSPSPSWSPRPRRLPTCWPMRVQRDA